MPRDPDIPPNLSTDKILALGAYGESVAEYRYGLLARKATDPRDREAFAEMATEEGGHRQRLDALLAGNFPGSEFVLEPDEKELVVVGPRLLEVRDADTFAQAMRFILGTERRTARFYKQMSETVALPEARELFRELAEEGADHYMRLRTLARARGIEEDAP